MLLFAQISSADNKIVNGGFESGLVGWLPPIQQASGSHVVITDDPTLVISGENSIEMYNPAPSANSWDVQLATVVSLTHSSYNLTFSTRALEPTTILVGAIHNDPNSDPPYAYRGLYQYINVPAGLTAHSVAFNSTADDSNVKIFVEMGQDKGQVWLDDFYLGLYGDDPAATYNLRVKLNGGDPKVKFPFTIIGQDGKVILFKVKGGSEYTTALPSNKYIITVRPLNSPAFRPSFYYLNMTGASKDAAVEFTKQPPKRK